MDKIKVSLLGSTGMVGQKMVRILSSHPFIELTKVSASPSKVGKKYEESVRWIEQGDIPDQVKEMRMVSTSPEDHKDVDVVLSALPNDLAEDVELKLVKEGITVISNASPFRMDPDVPLINPEVNWEHLQILKHQRERKGWKGVMVKNPNCTASIMTMPLKPIFSSVSSKRTFITTLQAVSGAGYSGLPFMAIENNVIPYIKGEEDKIPKEINKMLGKIEDGKIKNANNVIYVTSTRVPVKVGHMGVINVELQEKVDPESVKRSIREFKSLPQLRGLPTAPKFPIVLRDEEDRPQPARDLSEGMSTSVGRIKVEDDILRFVVLGDNLVRGAAGITVLTLEVMKELGYI
ncbi:aspartate-semialdehyde dehydrogenase [Sulfuracidifex tepidarius]|uniref:malonyl CoA reductase (malonate semialdehyde-forming) n=1 Tax=Sulfuracidifex tepidarius TaxID=1294262 RepID=A0A510DUH8_9CREN|nr:aspartate-semialdehyde dehydrogenase [Sulfuracidifex tepidarius]BBG23829.1 Aspartate-semialdehyde dehydrogenase [Sulfuracidifex tepidarius]BBG26584.1 Aspartate-semialdehyde dehydrogenase [Sulfuracidifex tepidarius]